MLLRTGLMIVRMHLWAYRIYVIVPPSPISFADLPNLPDLTPAPTGEGATFDFTAAQDRANVVVL